jgi:hypothetical protein
MGTSRGRRVRLLFTAGAAYACLLACSGMAAADDYRHVTSSADVAAARRAVLTRSDLWSPSEWKNVGNAAAPGAPGSTSGESCRGSRPNVVVTGDASSDFEYGHGAARIITSVNVFRTVSMLEAAWRHEVDVSAIACTRAALKSEAHKVGRLTSFRRLPFPRAGSHTVAFRSLIRLNDGRSALSDIVMFTHGRTLGVLVMGAVIDTPELPSLALQLERHFASTILSRIRTA